MPSPPSLASRFRGLLLGTAVGDSLGLPAEGLNPDRARRLLGDTLRHRLVLGRGMVSDDTEHALFVTQSLLAHPDDPDRFVRRLAWALRGWLLSLPAGVGFATLRSILRLWFGIPPQRSGVHSAGNGPAMRTAPIGALCSGDAEARQRFTEAATRITHTDRKALTGALGVSHLAAWIMRDRLGQHGRPEVSSFLQVLGEAGTDSEWRKTVRAMATALERDLFVEEFAASLGLERGVTGYVYHTVPVAAYAWFKHLGDFETTLGSVLRCGGDTDTTGAIAGALAGAAVGEHGIPDPWITGIADWPRTPSLLRRAADRLAHLCESGTSAGPVHYFWPGVLPRNGLFLAVVLGHGLRRLVRR